MTIEIKTKMEWTTEFQDMYTWKGSPIARDPPHLLPPAVSLLLASASSSQRLGVLLLLPAGRPSSPTRCLATPPRRHPPLVEPLPPRPPL
jgi:hypothetical protein